MKIIRNLLVGGSFLALGCAGAGVRPAAVTPADIPALQAAASRNPNDATIRFRLAAALLAAGRCDTAVVVARAGQILSPDDALGPLVIGGCQEKSGRPDSAFATYTTFAAQHPRARGVGAVRAKAQLALRSQAEQTARTALANEASISALPPEPSTLAVLPVTIAGDSSLAPLSRGLAELITTDLALIRSLRLLERVQIGALLDELKLGQTERADPANAARAGRLLRVERMVQGVAALQENGPARLSASVVRGDGTVRAGAQVTGVFKDLLDLEKQLVLGLAAELGIQLTEAERQRILRQGPKNLAAFLAYSDGLDALDREDYRAAAAAFGAAVQADPGFQAAQQQQQSAEAAPVAQQAAGGDLVTVIESVGMPAPGDVTSLDGVLDAGLKDVAPTSSDTQSGTTTTVQQLTPESRGISSLIQASGVLRIIFRRPL